MTAKTSALSWSGFSRSKRGGFLFLRSCKLRNFAEAPAGSKISLSRSEVSPAGVRLPISLTSRQARKNTIARMGNGGETSGDNWDL